MDQPLELVVEAIYDVLERTLPGMVMLRLGEIVFYFRSGVMDVGRVDPDEPGAEERHHGHRNDVGRKKRKHHRECESGSERVCTCWTPTSMMTGKNTMQVAQVAASTANCTSLPPFSEAVTGSSPISIWRKMFSKDDD